MQLNRVMAVVFRQYYLLRGSFTRIVPLFVWAAIDIVLWGFITKFLGTITSPTYGAIPMLLGAVLFWDFLVRVMHGTTMAFMEDMWSRNFLTIFASPLTTPEYLLGLVLTSVATSAIGLAVMIFLASAVFGLSIFSYGIIVFPFLLVLFLFGIALGILGCAIMLRLGPAAEWFIWPIPALISPFACVFYPLEMLPSWMQAIASTLPPTYVFESLRTIVSGASVSLYAMAISIALSFLYILLACVVYVRVYNTAVRTGLIARYTAESV